MLHVSLSEDEREKLRVLLRTEHIHTLAARFRTARETLIRLAYPDILRGKVHEGTALKLRAELAALEVGP